MKTFKMNLPIILLAIIEIAIGILLLINPGELMKWALIVFGAMLIIVGVVNLIRYFTTKEGEKRTVFTLIGAAVAIIIGLVCVTLVSLIVNLINASIILIAVIFGVILIIAGLYKIEVFAETRKAGLKASPLSIINAILSILFGAGLIALAVWKKDALQNAVWIMIAVGLFVTAFFDLVTLIHAGYLSGEERRAKKAEKQLEKDRKENAAESKDPPKNKIEDHPEKKD